MPVITSYLYNNIMTVEVFDLSDPTLNTRNRPVYARPIKVYQGIDNPIQVRVQNQDQKPVNLTGYALQADIQDPNNQATAYSFGVDYSDATKGVGTFTIDKLTVNSLEQRFYKITLKVVNIIDMIERPVYMDDNYTVPLDLEVLPAYYGTTETVPGIDETVIDSGSMTP